MNKIMASYRGNPGQFVLALIFQLRAIRPPAHSLLALVYYFELQWWNSHNSLSGKLQKRTCTRGTNIRSISSRFDFGIFKHVAAVSRASCFFHFLSIRIEFRDWKRDKRHRTFLSGRKERFLQCGWSVVVSTISGTRITPVAVAWVKTRQPDWDIMKIDYILHRFLQPFCLPGLSNKITA